MRQGGKHSCSGCITMFEMCVAGSNIDAISVYEEQSNRLMMIIIKIENVRTIW